MQNKQVLFLSIIAGVLVGVLELYIGHKYILEPLLNDPYFVIETYFAPYYYGFIKSIFVAIAFFLVYATRFFDRIRIEKAITTGILGASAFGLYYMVIRPPVSIQSGIIIFIVHFSFIAGISYLVWKFREG